MFVADRFEGKPRQRIEATVEHDLWHLHAPSGAELQERMERSLLNRAPISATESASTPVITTNSAPARRTPNLDGYRETESRYLEP